MATKPNTDHKEAKTIDLHKFTLYMVLNTLATGIIMLAVGYFLWINIHMDARQAVYQDIQVAAKQSK